MTNFHAEIERLQREIERLTQANGMLGEEREAWKQRASALDNDAMEWSRVADRHRIELRQSEAKNRRLRSALEKITHLGHMPIGDARDIAAEALGEMVIDAARVAPNWLSPSARADIDACDEFD